MESIPLEEFAASLGMAWRLSVRFLKVLEGKSRDEARSLKNKNYKLEKLKMQIRQELLEKKLKKMGMTMDDFKKRK